MQRIKPPFRIGEVVSPPCMVPVKTYPVTVADGKVTIEV